jgi:hypothetical protein
MLSREGRHDVGSLEADMGRPRRWPLRSVGAGESDARAALPGPLARTGRNWTASNLPRGVDREQAQMDRNWWAIQGQICPPRWALRRPIEAGWAPRG